MSEFLYRFQIQEFVLFGVCVCVGGGGGDWSQKDGGRWGGGAKM